MSIAAPPLLPFIALFPGMMSSLRDGPLPAIGSATHAEGRPVPFASRLAFTHVFAFSALSHTSVIWDNDRPSSLGVPTPALARLGNEFVTT
jgi:hypothetical protein